MTIKILSDSETARISYKKEVDDFLENGLPVAQIPQGRPKYHVHADTTNENINEANRTGVTNVTTTPPDATVSANIETINNASLSPHATEITTLKTDQLSASPTPINELP